MWDFICTCFKVCILLLLFPVIVMVLVFLAVYVFPIFFVAIPIMCIAWLWLLFT